MKISEPYSRSVQGLSQELSQEREDRCCADRTGSLPC